MKRFLITGLPRMRSAWLAALFSSDRVRCFHDAAQFGLSVPAMLTAVAESDAEVTGLIDPGAAVIYPRLAWELFCESPIFIVRRNQDDARGSFEKFLGMSLPNWDVGLTNYEWLINGPPNGLNKFNWVDYESLDDFEVVSWMHQTCTGRLLDRHRFDLFNTLKIEQHYSKVMAMLGLAVR